VVLDEEKKDIRMYVKKWCCVCRKRSFGNFFGQCRKSSPPSGGDTVNVEIKRKNFAASRADGKTGIKQGIAKRERLIYQVS
jgi:hypothetical protein